MPAPSTPSVPPVPPLLAYGLYREQGLPAPRSTWALLKVNGEDLGLFSMVEQIDGRFTAENFAGDGIQGREGLVHQQHLRIDRKRAGETDTLLHPAGQFVGIGLGEVAQSDRTEQRHRPVAPLLAADATQREGKLDVAYHGAPRH